MLGVGGVLLRGWFFETLVSIAFRSGLCICEIDR